jgi:hypothetical protein
MGLWGGIKTRLRSVIQWENPYPSSLFIKWTDDGDKIKNASEPRFCLRCSALGGSLIVSVFPFLTPTVFAQVNTTTLQEVKSTEAPIAETEALLEPDMTTSDVPIQSLIVPTQVARRADKTLSLVGNYGLYSFIVPGKKGAQLTWLKSPGSSWELDYFSGDYGLNKYGINLISFGERVIVGRYRKYWQSSFNLGLGFGERTFSFELGNQLTENIPGDIVRKEKLIELKRYVFDFSMGNRWHFNKGFILSMDWFELSMPFGPASKKTAIVDRITSTEGRKNTQKILDYLNYLPTLTFLKVGVGFAL